MAKIIEETVTIKLSVLVPDSSPDIITSINDELLQTLESVTRELVSSGVIVEAERT